jgi:hypothetical protein
MYNCTATRPSRELNTIEDSKTPTTQALTVSAAPLQSGEVMAMTSATTPAEILASWHETVYMASGSI